MSNKLEKQVKELIERLKDEDANVRKNAAYALGIFAENHPMHDLSDAVPALIVALNDEKLKDREQTVRLLGKIAAKNPESEEASEAVHVLIGTLSHEEMFIMRAAGWALEDIGKSAVPALIVALGNENSNVRGHAALVLARIAENTGSPKLLEAVPALIGALNDPDANVRWMVVGALGQIAKKNPGGKELLVAVPALIGALKDEKESVRSSAADALITIGPRNYNDFKVLHSAARKAKKEGKPTEEFVRIQAKWSDNLMDRADAYVYTAKNLPKPKVPRKPDGGHQVRKMQRVDA